MGKIEQDREVVNMKMNTDNWLSEDEQYKETLSSDEISRIKDPNLRMIREKHWEYRNRIFLDEGNIPDDEFMRLCDEDVKKEQEELEMYRKNKK